MAMNYSHAFHAGNFADIVKHAALLALLGRLQADPAPLAVIDTHGGRGLYDLDAQRLKGDLHPVDARTITSNFDYLLPPW